MSWFKIKTILFILVTFLTANTPEAAVGQSSKISGVSKKKNKNNKKNKKKRKKKKNRKSQHPTLSLGGGLGYIFTTTSGGGYDLGGGVEADLQITYRPFQKLSLGFHPTIMLLGSGTSAPVSYDVTTTDEDGDSQTETIPTGLSVGGTGYNFGVKLHFFTQGIFDLWTGGGIGSYTLNGTLFYNSSDNGSDEDQANRDKYNDSLPQDSTSVFSYFVGFGGDLRFFNTFEISGDITYRIFDDLDYTEILGFVVEGVRGTTIKVSATYIII